MRPRTQSNRRDQGFSLVDSVISIALMGMLVVGILALLQASLRAGTTHRDHSNAYAWLQSASDQLYAAPKVHCNPSAADGGEAAVRAAYEAVVDGINNPEAWKATQIRVVAPVKFWNAVDTNGDNVAEYFFGSGCQDDQGLGLQLIALEVRSPTGRILETVEIVK